MWYYHNGALRNDVARRDMEYNGECMASKPRTKL